MRARLLAFLLVSAFLVPLGCEAPPSRVPERAHDKAGLYADPGLVPTREGERARRELALAGELEAQTRLARGVQAVQVSARESEDGSVVVIADLAIDSSADREGLPAQLEADAQLLAPRARVHVTLHEAAVPSPPSDERTLPLVLAVLALGLSAGVALERARLRRMLSRA